MHTHDDHRKRVKMRFMQEGLDNFDEVHALELLLFYAIPRIDTKPIARALLDRFDTFRGVLEAEPEQLEQVDGVGENVAIYLKLLRQTSRYYNTQRSQKTMVFNHVSEYGKLFVDNSDGRTNETVFLLCLDAKCKMLSFKILGEGDAVSTNLPFRKVAETAINTKAAMVILAHNHPYGVAVPSSEDIMLTEQLRRSLETLNIKLIDHVIVADGEYVSMAQSGYFG